MSLNSFAKLFLFIAVLSNVVACNKNLGNDRELTSFDREETSAQAIIGGTEVKSSDEVAKYVVGIANTVKGFICSGSLVTESIVMTAAHCLVGQPQELVIIFGKDMQHPFAVRKVVTYQANPNWANNQNNEKNTGDIGFLRFTGGLPDGFEPAALLISWDYIKDGAPVVLAGYGISNGTTHVGAMTLRQVAVNVEKSKYSETEVLLNQKGGKGACHGDSGGPAYVKAGDRLLLWGVTSRGYDDDNDDCGDYAIYSNSLGFKNWISSILNSWDPLYGSRIRGLKLY